MPGELTVRLGLHRDKQPDLPVLIQLHARFSMEFSALSDGAFMGVVSYPAYVRAEQERISTNNAMMGLLVGSKLAARTLELTEGSQLTLSTMFPKVEHIGRFDLKTETARQVLNDSESLLGGMAVLYAFGLHEDLMRDMLSLLVDDNQFSANELKNIRSVEIHSKFCSITNTVFRPELLEVFHIVRQIRNARIHNGGKVKAHLVTEVVKLSPAARKLWKDTVGVEVPNYVEGDIADVGLNELILILAVTKRLSEAANEGLQKSISRSHWLQVFKVHMTSDRKLIGNESQKLRKMKGFARQFYEPLCFTSAELQSTL